MLVVFTTSGSEADCVLAADECVESHYHLTERTAPESGGGGKKIDTA